MHKYTRTLAVSGTLFGLIGLPDGVAADVPESPEPIKLAINEWNSPYGGHRCAGKDLETVTKERVDNDEAMCKPWVDKAMH